VTRVVDDPEGAADAVPRTERLARLFREQHGPLVAYLTSRLRSVQEAREVAQEAFVRLLQLPRAGSAARLVRGYLFRTAKHLAIDRLRHQAVQRAALQRELPDRPAEASDPAEQLAAREHAQDLLGFLQELPPKCRRVLELHRLEGLSQQEVGARLSLSDRMVRRYLTHAMVYCRLRLDGLSANEASRRTPL
jgi:RNA polymerase sigma-70 factor (ECF subfamily)